MVSKFLLCGILLVLTSSFVYAADFLIRADLPRRIETGESFFLRLETFNKKPANIAMEVELPEEISGVLSLQQIGSSRGTIERVKTGSRTIVKCNFGSVAINEMAKCGLSFFAISRQSVRIPVRLVVDRKTLSSIIVTRNIFPGLSVDYVSETLRSIYKDCSQSPDINICYEKEKKERIGVGKRYFSILN